MVATEVDYWAGLVKRATLGARHFVPAILLMAIFVEIAGAQVPRAPELAQAGLFLTMLDFYFSAAARSLGLTTSSSFWLASYRSGASIEPLLIATGLFLLVCTAGLCMLFAESTTLRVLVSALTVATCLYVLLRCWPTWAIPYYFRGRITWSPAASASRWNGPGVHLALKLTTGRGWRSKQGLRVVLLTTLISLVVAADWLTPSSELVLFLLLYACLLPVFSMVVVAGCGERLALAGINTNVDGTSGPPESD